MAAEAPSPRARNPSLRWGLWRRPATRGEGRWEPLREGKQRRGMKGRAVLAQREGGRESGKVGQSHRPHWAGHAPSPAQRPAPTGPSGPSLLQAWGHSKRQVWEPTGWWREGDRQENTAVGSGQQGRSRGAGRRGRVPSPGGGPAEAPAQREAGGTGRSLLQSLRRGRVRSARGFVAAAEHRALQLGFRSWLWCFSKGCV